MLAKYLFQNDAEDRVGLPGSVLQTSRKLVFEKAEGPVYYEPPRATASQSTPGSPNLSNVQGYDND